MSTLLSAVFTEFGGRIGEGTIGTGRNTRTARIVVKKVSLTSIALSAVPRKHRTSSTIIVAHLAVVGKRGTYKLAQGTLSVTKGRANDEIVLSSSASIGDVGAVETIISGAIITCAASCITRSTLIGRVVSIVAIWTFIFAGVIFQIKRNSSSSQSTRSAVS